MNHKDLCKIAASLKVISEGKLIRTEKENFYLNGCQDIVAKKLTYLIPTGTVELIYHNHVLMGVNYESNQPKWGFTGYGITPLEYWDYGQKKLQEEEKRKNWPKVSVYPTKPIDNRWEYWDFNDGLDFIIKEMDRKTKETKEFTVNVKWDDRGYYGEVYIGNVRTEPAVSECVLENLEKYLKNKLEY